MKLRLRAICGLGTLTAICFLGTGVAVGAVELETRDVFDASQILPAKLRQSIHHRVRDDVRVDNGYFVFEVESDFGNYPVRSVGVLRNRVHEITTMAQALAQFEYSDEEFLHSIRGQRGVASESVVDILTRPVETVSQLASNLSSNINQTLEGDYGEGFSGERVPPSGPSGDPGPQRRSAASQLNLDVYSSNPDVQGFLDKVEEARRLGRMRSAMATISGSEPEPNVINAVFGHKIRTLLKNETAESLTYYNESRLQRMAIDENVTADFLAHPAYSPRNQTLLVAYLTLLPDVANRTALVQSALSARTETDAIANRYVARMLVHYDREVGPLSTLDLTGVGIKATTTTGNTVAFVRHDVLLWNEPTVSLAQDLGHTLREFGTAELVMSGLLSEWARERLNARKIRVRERFSFD